MKVYIAAPYPARTDAIAVMHRLESVGHHVTSRWLKDDEDPFDVTAQSKYAAKALADVRVADVLLALNAPEWANAGTGGRHVELGCALALGKQVVLLGRRSNVFHHLSVVRVIERIEDL